MTRADRQSVSEQFDLFLPYLADMPLRDQREMMERPFFSLAKSKRVKPIDYKSPDGKLWVHVSGNPDYGMATIWDADILIYCASVLADMARRGLNQQCVEFFRAARHPHQIAAPFERALQRPREGGVVLDNEEAAIGVGGDHGRLAGVRGRWRLTLAPPPGR